MTPNPTPISIWQPFVTAEGTVWRRPAPSALGDHYAARREITATPAPGVRRVCFFGESAAAGYLYAPHLTPAGVLEAHLRVLSSDPPGSREPTGVAEPHGWEVIDLARTNERAASLAATVEAAAQLSPDHLVIFAGNNWKLLETAYLSPLVLSSPGSSPSRLAPPGLSPPPRRELAEALRTEGPVGAARLARRRGAEAVAAAFQRVAVVAAELAVPVTVVLPEVNLADWETAQPPVVLPGNGCARWFELLQRAHRGLAAVGAGAGGAPPGVGEADDAAIRDRLAAVEAAAWEMVALDGGTCPTPFRLLAAARLAAPIPLLEEARDAALSELEAIHTPLLAFLAAPQADEVACRLLRGICRHHGFATVDLRRAFAEWTGSPLPGRRMFLDYCHLTAEGIHVAMAAVAAEVWRQETGQPVAHGSGRGTERLPRQPVSAAAEATACLGAAVHTAHRHGPVTDRGDLLDHWCAAALDADPEGAAAAMVDLATARLAAAPAGRSQSLRGRASSFGPDGGSRTRVALPAILTTAQERNLARPAPLLLQHGWRWPHLDGDLLRAMHGALMRRGRPEAAEMVERVSRSAPGETVTEDARGKRAAARRPASTRTAAPQALELVHPPYHLASPVTQPLAAAMAPEGMAPRAFLRALWPHTSFDFVDPAGWWRQVVVVARLGQTAGNPGSAPAGEPAPLTLDLDGHGLGGSPLGGRWQRFTLDLPAAGPTSRPTSPLGLRRLTLVWPLPDDAGPEPLAPAIRRLEAGQEALLHAVFGELFSLRLLR